jgi:hypothetical protein
MERVVGTHWIGFVGLRARPNTRQKKKSLVPAGYRIPAVQSIVRRYTD